MDTDTEREPRTDAYWKRRVYVLGGGIALIGLMAWSCSGSGHGKSTAQLRNAAAAASLSPLAAPPAIGTPTPSASATPSPVPSGSASPSVKASAQPVKRRPGDACAETDVVMTFAATKTTYKGAQHPRFQLSVVNTARMPCTFDVGPGHLDVRIVSGSDRVWSSAQCLGAGSSIQMLRRGVPYIAAIDWNRRRCGADPARAQPGTYVAYAKAGGLKTAHQVFFLR
jgi:hypothetical protein